MFGPGACNDCPCEGGDGGIGFGACNCACHGDPRQPPPRPPKLELTDEGKAAFRELLDKYRPTFDKAPPVVLYAELPREPRTTDYCGRCGESPESGTHLFGHAWVPLVDVKRGLAPHTYTRAEIEEAERRAFQIVYPSGNNIPVLRAEPSMKIVIRFSLGRKQKRHCRLVVGAANCEVQTADHLGDPVWIATGRGMPSVQRVLEAGLAKFAETSGEVQQRICPVPGRVGSFPMYPPGVTSVGRPERLEVEVGDMTALRAEAVDALSPHGSDNL